VHRIIMGPFCTCYCCDDCALEPSLARLAAAAAASGNIRRRLCSAASADHCSTDGTDAQQQVPLSERSPPADHLPATRRCHATRLMICTCHSHSQELQYSAAMSPCNVLRDVCTSITLWHTEDWAFCMLDTLHVFTALTHIRHQRTPVAPAPLPGNLCTGGLLAGMTQNGLNRQPSSLRCTCAPHETAGSFKGRLTSERIHLAFQDPH
jgi:hypothetical protein